MLQFRKALCLLLVCYCLASSSHVYIRDWSITPSDTTFLHQGTLFQTDSNAYPVATCEITNPKTERVCNITLAGDGRNDHSCPGIKIFADEGKELFFNGYFQITPFSDDYVSVGWYDQPEGDTKEPKLDHSLKITLVNVKKCTSAHFTFPVDKVTYGFFPAIVYYNDRVDFILNSKKACNGNTKCKLTFDLNGKQKGNVKLYDPDISQYASAVSEEDPSKGFFVHSQDLSSLTVLLVNRRGKGKQLSSVKFAPETSEQDRLLSFSNAHELYSICRMHKGPQPTNIDCSQYDGKGERKANGIIELTKSADWMAVRSLAGGNILVATSGTDEKEPKNFKVYKIYGDGSPVGNIDVKGPGFSCKDKDNGLEVRISQSMGRDICFDFSCQQGKNDINYYRKCISYDHFSN